MPKSNVTVKEIASVTDDSEGVVKIRFKDSDEVMYRPGSAARLLNNHYSGYAYATKLYMLKAPSLHRADCPEVSLMSTSNMLIAYEDMDMDRAIHMAKIELLKKAVDKLPSLYKFVDSVLWSPYSHWLDGGGDIVTIEEDEEKFPVKVHPGRITGSKFNYEYTFGDVKIKGWTESGDLFGFEVIERKAGEEWVSVPDHERVMYSCSGLKSEETPEEILSNGVKQLYITILMESSELNGATGDPEIDRRLINIDGPDFDFSGEMLFLPEDAVEFFQEKEEFRQDTSTFRYFVNGDEIKGSKEFHIALEQGGFVFGMALEYQEDTGSFTVYGVRSVVSDVKHNEEWVRDMEKFIQELRMMSKNMDVGHENLDVLCMKNEYIFPTSMVTNATKHYVSNIRKENTLTNGVKVK